MKSECAKSNTWRAEGREREKILKRLKNITGDG
jgi:hypothetical protein